MDEAKKIGTIVKEETQEDDQEDYDSEEDDDEPFSKETIELSSIAKV